MTSTDEGAVLKLQKAVRVLCEQALRTGNEDEITYISLRSQLRQLNFPEDLLKAEKAAIKTLATTYLTSKGKQEEPVASTSKPETVLEDGLLSEVQGEIVKPKKRKKADSSFKSKEFINSEGEPTSGPPDGSPPPKKKPKKSKAPVAVESDHASPPAGEKRKKSKAVGEKKTGDPQSISSQYRSSNTFEVSLYREAEIQRLKEFINACGSKIMKRDLQDQSHSNKVKFLKARLEELGMTGRLSLAKAKEIRQKLQLAKEHADLMDLNSTMDLEGGRKTRGDKAVHPARKAKRAIISDDEDDSSQEADSRFERHQKQLDKRRSKNVERFAGMMGL